MLQLISLRIKKSSADFLSGPDAKTHYEPKVSLVPHKPKSLTNNRTMFKERWKSLFAQLLASGFKSDNFGLTRTREGDLWTFLLPIKISDN